MFLGFEKSYLKKKKEKSYLVYYTLMCTQKYMNMLHNTRSREAFRNQAFFSQEKQTFTLSGIGHGDKQFISVGHVMLTNGELYFSEVAWLGESEIKDRGREVIQNQNRAKGNKPNKLLSEGGAHASLF